MRRFTRPLSDSQRAATDARKATFRALAKQVAQLTDDERAALASRVSVATVEGKALSPHNQCLIVLQCKDATMVGGFRQWLASGRAVRKGERGISIWVPTFRKPRDGGGDGGEGGADVGFIMGTVFDVAQTDEATAWRPASAVA